MISAGVNRLERVGPRDVSTAQSLNLSVRLAQSFTFSTADSLNTTEILFPCFQKVAKLTLANYLTRPLATRCRDNCVEVWQCRKTYDVRYHKYLLMHYSYQQRQQRTPDKTKFNYLRNEKYIFSFCPLRFTQPKPPKSLLFQALKNFIKNLITNDFPPMSHYISYTYLF